MTHVDHMDLAEAAATHGVEDDNEPVFTDGAVDEAGLATHAEEDVKPKKATGRRRAGQRTEAAVAEGVLFEATSEEKRAEARRMHDTRIGLLIGPKNLVKLRTFGYDVTFVQEAPLASGIAHRGMTE